MSSSSDESIDKEPPQLEVHEEESVEPSMSEWSSLDPSLEVVNPKMALFDKGLYDPGSGEICAAHITMSDSAVLRHHYYNYPSVKDPGIINVLLGPPPKPVYPDDGQELYLALCKQMNQCPVRIFHRALLGSKANLSYYSVNPYGIQAMTKSLVNNKTLTVLDLTDNFLNDDACFHLGEMLMINTVLQELNLPGCRIGASGARRLCAGLPSNKTLRALNLSRNQLGDEGAGHFADAVFSRASVQEINLSFNNLSGKAAQTLSESLQWNKKVTHIDLSHNLLFSFPSGLYNLLTELETSPILNYVNISHNNLTGPKASAGIKLVFSAPHLQHLDISSNKLSTTEDVINLTTAMTKPKSMVTYNVSFNPITSKDSLMFLYKLQSKRCKIKVLNMDGINVNVKFTEQLKAMMDLSFKKDVQVTHGYVEGTYKAVVPDPREIVLNRIEFICQKPKRKKVDIALVAYSFLKEGLNLLDVKEFIRLVKLEGIDLDEDLVAALQVTFPGPPSRKGPLKIDIAMMAEYMQRKWPERKLPPTPPPEPIIVPEPVPEPKKGGKTKKAGKK